ncbi:VirD4-like conjugal transfer protein, CD1115 family [Streptococcus dentiloxodontae]
MTEEVTYQRSKVPYLIFALVAFYLTHWLVKLFQAAPDTSSMADPLGTGRFSWMMSHFSEKAWIDLQFNLWSAGLGVAVAFLVFLMAFRRRQTGVYRHQEEHGSARFATTEEMKRYEDEDPSHNMIFSEHAQMGLYNKRLPYLYQVNKNVMVIGLPGDGKTRSVGKPNIMQLNASFAMTDPKGLTVFETGKLLEEQGYTVKVLDLISLENSDTFNIFQYMTSENDIDRVAEALIMATQRSDNKGEDFWAQAEAFLIRALIGYLYFDGKVKGNYEPNLAQVTDMLRLLKRENPDVESPVELMFAALEEDLPGNYACKQFNLFMSNFGGNTLMSVLAIAASRFSVFDHAAVRQIIAHDTMEIEKWQTEKTAVFVAIPEADGAYNFIANLLFVTCFRVLPAEADKVLRGNHPTVKAENLIHFRYLLDEFAQLGKLMNVTESQSSIRSREQSMTIFIQAISQMKALYGDQWRTLFNNSGTHIYLGTQDKETMEYYSMRAGKQTINQDNSSQTYNAQNGSSSVTTSSIGRDLMTPDEIARIGGDEALVFVSKQNVYKDRRYPLENHPHYAEISEGPGDGKWYHYERTMTDIEEWYQNVVVSDVEIIDRAAVTDMDLPWNQTELTA